MNNIQSNDNLIRLVQLAYREAVWAYNKNRRVDGLIGEPQSAMLEAISRIIEVLNTVDPKNANRFITSTYDLYL